MKLQLFLRLGMKNLFQIGGLDYLFIYSGRMGLHGNFCEIVSRLNSVYLWFILKFVNFH